MSENEKPVDPTELSPETAAQAAPTPEKEPEPAPPEPECCDSAPETADGSAPCPGPHTAEEPEKSVPQAEESVPDQQPEQ